VNAQTVWSEDFTGFAAPADYIQGVSNYTFGFDGDTNAAFDTNVGGGDNVKKLSSELWAKSGGAATAFGFNDVGGGNIALQTNNNGSGTMKGAGVFLASSIFTAGTGTYKLTYDLLADGESNNVNTRIWIGTSSTHDQTATNGWGIDLSDVNLGTPASPFLTSGTTIVGATASANLNTSANIIGGELVFSYTAGEDVSLVFGSGGTNAAFDNLSISYIVDDGSTGGLTEQDLIDLRVGSTLIDASSGSATITIQMEESSDLSTWSDMGADGQATVTVPMTGDASFFRVRTN
jgi:hypothetical protein